MIEVIGAVNWAELTVAQEQVLGHLDERPVSWIYDYTRAQICGPGEVTRDALKHHQIDGQSDGACAVIVPMEDLGAWKTHLREIRAVGRHRALFGEDGKQEAMLWAARQAQRLRRIAGEPLSSIPGDL